MQKMSTGILLHCLDQFCCDYLMKVLKQTPPALPQAVHKTWQQSWVHQSHFPGLGNVPVNLYSFIDQYNPKANQYMWKSHRELAKYPRNGTRTWDHCNSWVSFNIYITQPKEPCTHLKRKKIHNYSAYTSN